MSVRLFASFFFLLAVAMPLQAGTVRPTDGERLLLTRAAGDGGKTTFEIISRFRREQLERGMLKLVSLHGTTLSKIISEGNRSTRKIN